MSGIRNALVFIIVCMVFIIGGGAVGYLGAERLRSANSPIKISSSPTPNPTELQATVAYGTQIAATARAVTGGILFEDLQVFSASQENNDTKTISNTENGLVLTIKRAGTKIWTVAGIALPSDVDVSVTAQGTSPDPCDGWSYSLNIRQYFDYRTSVPFYNFRIQGDHIWTFGWYTGSQIGSRVLAAGKIDSNFDIHKANLIRVVAIGKHFDLYINDQKVGEVDDPNAVQNTKNDVGVAIETCSTPASALFTNLIVKTPK